MPSITDALRARGIGGGQGISQTDLTALIDVTNVAEANNDAIKLDVINKLKTLNPDLIVNTSSTWSTIREAIASMQYKGAIAITPGAADVIIPAGYHNGSGKVYGVPVPVANVLSGTMIAGQTGIMPNKGAVTLTPGPSDVPIPAGYHNGAGKVSAVVVPTSKLVEGSTVAGQAGTLKDFSRAKLGTGPAYIAAKSAKGDGSGNLVLEPDTGYYTSGLNATGFGSLAANDPNFIPANILSGKSIFGVVGSATPRQYATGAGVYQGQNPSAWITMTKADGASTSTYWAKTGVLNLGFTPKILVIRYTGSSNYMFSFYTLWFDFGDKDRYYLQSSLTEYQYAASQNQSGIYVRSDGWYLPVPVSGSAQYEWFAWG